MRRGFHRGRVCDGASRYFRAKDIFGKYGQSGLGILELFPAAFPTNCEYLEKHPPNHLAEVAGRSSGTR